MIFHHEHHVHHVRRKKRVLDAKIKENYETIQQLTSQLQQMQEQMNSMNDSGEFQEAESNYSGRLSHVSSQPEIIPSSRSLLSRDKVTVASFMESVWSTKKTFLEINFPRLNHLEIFLKEFHLTTCKEIEKQPLEIRR